MDARGISIRPNTGPMKETHPYVVTYEQPEITGLAQCEFLCKGWHDFYTNRAPDYSNTPIEPSNKGTP